MIGERKVVQVLDYEKQTRNGKLSPADFKDFPKSNVIQLFLEPEGKLTIRPSGTEPKVKIYASLKHKNNPATLDELAQARTELEDEIASIAGLFIARTGLTG
jgi:phosphoglucomutase/phosphomannomutase